MPSRPRSRLDLVRLGLLTGGLLVLAAAGAGGCQSASEAQAGERCFVTTDCAPGLVCIPSGESGSSTTCSNNVGGIQKEPAGPGGPMTSSSGAIPESDGGSSGTEPGDGGSSTSSSSSSGAASSSGGSSSSSASSSTSSSSSGAPDAGDDDAGP